jgi:hypothetical protein
MPRVLRYVYQARHRDFRPDDFDRLIGGPWVMTINGETYEGTLMSARMMTDRRRFDLSVLVDEIPVALGLVEPINLHARRLETT